LHMHMYSILDFIERVPEIKESDWFIAVI